MLRLVTALLISIGYLVALLHLSPYQQRSTAVVAVACNMTLTCTFIAALLVCDAQSKMRPSHRLFSISCGVASAASF
jgi:hypothetical protein